MKKKDFEDDGRQIANMSGIDRSYYSMRMGRRKSKAKASATNDDVNPHSYKPEPQLTKRETRQVVANAILATLLLGAVFIGGAALFILFCTEIWFR